MKKFLIVALCIGLSACEHARNDTSANDRGSYYSAMLEDSEVVHKTPEDMIQEGSQEEFLMSVGDKILFGFDSYNLTQKDMDIVKSQSEWLKKNPDYNIVLEGHCDERGTRDYNMGLGERRANTVRDIMITTGVEASRIKVISYGKEKPIVEGHNEEAWKENRRVVTVTHPLDIHAMAENS